MELEGENTGHCVLFKLLHGLSCQNIILFCGKTLWMLFKCFSSHMIVLSMYFFLSSVPTQVDSYKYIQHGYMKMETCLLCYFMQTLLF